MNNTLPITIAQINPTIGDFTGNLALIAQAMLDAHQQQAKLLVFPELALCGYYPGDLLNEADFIAACDQALTFVQAQTQRYPELTIIIGLPIRRHAPGKPLYNAPVAIQQGNIIACYRKQLLPTYNIFDERRHFEPGPNEAVCINIAGFNIGVMICEDAWNDASIDYAINPFDSLATAKPDFIVSINASPANIGKRVQRHQIFCQAAQRHQIAMLYVNQVGGQDSLVFDSASFAVNANGVIAYECPAFEAVNTTVYFTNSSFITSEQPIATLSHEDSILKHIVLGLKDYARRCGFSSVVVGSSGGIDSALTLAIAVEALGAEHVTAITMPSQFSSTGSITDSEALCTALGIRLYTHPIKQLVESYSQQFAHAFSTPLTGVALENLQARIRGTVLMAYSNQTGALVLTTGNKSELAVGYCTLYGDTNGGLGLIGDLYKTEVYQLAHYLNQRAGRELIPTAILTKEPSAELAPDQRDTDSLPPYPVLDEILKILLEGELLTEAEFHHAKTFVNQYRQTIEGDTVYRRIAAMINRNEYKRRQAPPLIRIRPRAFGAGRQMPISANY